MAVYEGTDTNVLPENSVLENFRIGEDPVKNSIRLRDLMQFSGRNILKSGWRAF